MSLQKQQVKPTLFSYKIKQNNHSTQILAHQFKKILIIKGEGNEVKIHAAWRYGRTTGNNTRSPCGIVSISAGASPLILISNP